MPLFSGGFCLLPVRVALLAALPRADTAAASEGRQTSLVCRITL